MCKYNKCAKNLNYIQRLASVWCYVAGRPTQVVMFVSIQTDLSSAAVQNVPASLATNLWKFMWSSFTVAFPSVHVAHNLRAPACECNIYDVLSCAAHISLCFTGIREANVGCSPQIGDKDRCWWGEPFVRTEKKKPPLLSANVRNSKSLSSYLRLLPCSYHLFLYKWPVVRHSTLYGKGFVSVEEHTLL